MGKKINAGISRGENLFVSLILCNLGIFSLSLDQEEELCSRGGVQLISGRWHSAAEDRDRCHVISGKYASSVDFISGYLNYSL